MSMLSTVDEALLNQLKARIEEIAGLQSSMEINQKDFDFLLFYIEEKTGHKLGLTTIKRIWRNEFQRLPHLSTLNMLAQLAFNEDWLTLKKNFLEEQKLHQSNGIAHTVPKPDTAIKRRIPLPVLVGLAMVMLVVIVVFYWFNSTTLINADNVQFSARPTADGNVPNSVVFTYDVSTVNADKFFLQQSWDSSKKIEISKTSNKQTDIYYEPGYHYAKLFANTQIIKEIPVHIRYNNWFVRFRYPDGELRRIENEDLYRDGYLGIKKDYLSKHAENLKNNYQLGYMLSKDFGVSADAFQFSSAFKFDSIAAPSCPIVNLLIKGDKDYMFLTFGNKGCESNLSFRCGDTRIDGKTNDLSLFGTDIFNWQNARVYVANKKITIFLNKKIILETSYSKDLGNLKELDFFFNGIGSIDTIELNDASDKIKRKEDF